MVRRLRTTCRGLTLSHYRLLSSHCQVIYVLIVRTLRKPSQRAAASCTARCCRAECARCSISATSAAPTPRSSSTWAWAPASCVCKVSCSHKYCCCFQRRRVRPVRNPGRAAVRSHRALRWQWDEGAWPRSIACRLLGVLAGYSGYIFVRVVYGRLTIRRRSRWCDRPSSLFAVFLMYPNLREVMGVELCAARFRVGELALRRLATRRPLEFRITLTTPDEIVLATVSPVCVLEVLACAVC